MIYRVINDQVRDNLINEIKSRPVGYQVKIKDLKRSNPQNAYYWMCLTIIGNDLGYSKNELHESLKREFIGTDEGKDYFGNLYIRPKSSAKLKKKEFSEYINKVQIFAMNEGIKLPQPDYYGLDCHDKMA